MKKKNILVTGSNGQLGSELKELSCHFSQYNYFFTSREELNICDKRAVEAFVNEYSIDTIINTAAYTAVDKAEAEPEFADEINHLAVKGLAELCKAEELSLIHISTDYVFNGEGFKPYPTNYPTEPVNIYGASKLKGEEAIKKINPINSLIIRTSWVYSSYGNNFVKTMLRLGEDRDEINVIYDQIGAPTYARDLAWFILDKAIEVQNEEIQTYHFTNEGVCSWYDFAKEIMNFGNRSCIVNPIPTTAYPTPAKRPHYSLLEKTDTKEDFGIEIPYWKDSLKNCIETIRNNSSKIRVN